jgi:hypothetical protein
MEQPPTKGQVVGSSPTARTVRRCAALAVGFLLCRCFLPGKNLAHRADEVCDRWLSLNKFSYLFRSPPSRIMLLHAELY